MENQELTKEQLEQMVQSAQMVADQLAARLGENEKYIAQLTVANQIAQSKIKELTEAQQISESGE